MFILFYGLPKTALMSTKGNNTPGGDFLISGIRVCATDQGRFFTSKNPEQAQILKFYSRTGPTF